MSDAAERSSKLMLEKGTLALLFRRSVLTVKADNTGTRSGSHIAPNRNASPSLKILSSFLKNVTQSYQSNTCTVVKHKIVPKGFPDSRPLPIPSLPSHPTCQKTNTLLTIPCGISIFVNRLFLLFLGIWTSDNIY